MYTEMQLGFINNSSQVAASRAAAVRNIRDAISDRTGGISYYTSLKELKNSLNTDPDAFEKLRARLYHAYDKFIVNGRAVFSLACDEESFEKIKDVALPMKDRLTDTLDNATAELLSGNIALCAPCDIVFNGYSFNIDSKLSGGKLMLAKNILTLEYLWQKIRVENGAYGCGAAQNPAMRLDMYSYRDPQIKSTLDTFSKAGEFLSTLSLSDRAVEDYIISVIRKLDNPQLPRSIAYLETVRTLLGRDDEDIRRERDELLSATLGDLNSIGKALDECSKDASYCTVGNAENIRLNSQLYDEIITL